MIQRTEAISIMFTKEEAKKLREQLLSLGKKAHPKAPNYVNDLLPYGEYGLLNELYLDLYISDDEE